MTTDALDISTQTLEYISSHPGCKLYDIQTHIAIARKLTSPDIPKVNRAVDELLKSGRITRQELGRPEDEDYNYFPAKTSTQVNSGTREEAPKPKALESLSGENA